MLYKKPWPVTARCSADSGVTKQWSSNNIRATCNMEKIKTNNSFYNIWMLCKHQFYITIIITMTLGWKWESNQYVVTYFTTIFQ